MGVTAHLRGGVPATSRAAGAEAAPTRRGSPSRGCATPPGGRAAPRWSSCCRPPSWSPTCCTRPAPPWPAAHVGGPRRGRPGGPRPLPGRPYRGHVTEPLPDWLSAARRITVLTGAGISTDSGIPDFRGPQGVWTRDPEAEKLSTLQYYVADPEIRRRAWQERLRHPAWTARPNAGHAALVDLERQGRLRALLTQNIDGLHQQAGSPQRPGSSPSLFVELHGTVHEVTCLTCGERTPMRSAPVQGPAASLRVVGGTGVL